jgi:hypothetical protein
LLERGIAVWEESGGRANSPYYKTALAEGMAQRGDLDRALVLIGEVIAQIERPGWEGAGRRGPRPAGADPRLVLPKASTPRT